MLVALCAIFTIFFVTWLTHLVHIWGNPKCKGKLPPGSMGFPLIGETIQFFFPYNNLDISPFIKTRAERYGPLFCTNLVGKPMVVSTDPEVNYYIFQQEGKLFECYYTESFSKILGDVSILTYHRELHKYLKNLILRLAGPENLKQNMLGEIDANTRQSLESWSNHGRVEVKEASTKMIFDYVTKKILSYDDEEGLKKLRENFVAFLDGLVSFPLNIPGTSFYACLRGRSNVVEVIRRVFQERKQSKGTHGDFLYHLLEEVKKEGTILTEELAVNLVFLLLFATYETTSSAIGVAMKFLHEHPLALERLTNEHEEILRNRSKEKEDITWEEYRSMTFTYMVMNETMRLANIAPVLIRKVTQDVELKGYTIPAGWLVMASTASNHFDPTMHKDPYTFNPWRWEGQMLHAGSKNFMAFGGGARLCVGAELAKLQIAVFLHHLVTKYRWEITGGGDITRSPSLTFPNGLHVQISPK